MLTEPKEIEIISKATQKNVRDPRRSRKPFEHIFEDFLGSVDLAGCTLLDLGPGQFDFGVLAKGRGATTYSIDKDPAVIELGRFKGMPTIEGRLQDINSKMFDTKFDGIFCKYSIDAFWFDNDDEQNTFIDTLCGLLKPGGWAWIAPWNGGARELTEEQIEEALSVQARRFMEHDFWAVDLTEELSTYYGVHGRTANRALFCLNLDKPKQLEHVDPLVPGSCWTVPDFKNPHSTGGSPAGRSISTILKRVIKRLVR